MLIEDIRKDLHQIPELGRKEYATRAYIIAFLQSLELDFEKVAGTGVLTYFDVGKPNTICFRADMDGLPIEELNDVPYRSKNAGVAHACGHDGHMAMLLSFIEWARSNKKRLASNVLCLFQPSEEDRAGAYDILESGVLDKYNVKEIYAFHIWPNLKKGELFTKPEGLLASSCEVNIKIIGKSVHAANRSLGIDALEASTRLVQDLYNMTANLSGKCLFSIGKLNAGTARNNVAAEANLEATFRFFEDPVFDEFKHNLDLLVQRYEQEKVKIITNLNNIYKSVINSHDLVAKYQKVLNLNILDEGFLQAEDFGCYTRKYKGMFILLGCGDTPLLHAYDFDFDMDILNVGKKAYIAIATH